jgi:DtxR family transcriptional regulator, Mn-dependent transcriptional regulator
LEPLVALIIGISVLGFATLLFFPEKGLLYKIREMNRDKTKIFIEDTLKHLYDCEYKGIDCSLHSIAGNSQLKGEQAAKIIAKLESMNLAKYQNNKVSLTSEGRTYALRIIRIHRLWEKFLADHTSVNETEWHKIAEEKEHEISADEAKQLAAKLGNPLLDPHGDPIPSESGELPIEEGVSLNSLNEGMFAVIKHIEDEPKEVYAQLTAQKLSPGMQIYILENSKDRIRFEAEGEVIVLAPILASNISVIQINEKDSFQGTYESLSSLEEDETAVIIGISKALRGQQRRRMLDFGLVPGTPVKAALKSLSGDPTGYEVRGAVIALRKNQADLIFIQKSN